MGVYSPAVNDAPLDATFRDLRHSPFALEIRSSPTQPENIDNCTVVLKDLRVRVLP